VDGAAVPARVGTIKKYMTIKTTKNRTIILLDAYERLYRCFGPQHWWPAESHFEVVVGAILTQSAAWANVEKAILNLKKADALSLQALRTIDQAELAALIHSCGYYNAKAKKLKSFAEWLGSHYGGNLEDMFYYSTTGLRKELLAVHGIGEETADSILLYAGNRPVFVIDAYTQRIIDRLGLKPRGDKYRHYQDLFMKNLPADPEMFNEYHALLVALGKDVCRKKPLCMKCCLRTLCRFPIL
jgi:endonuclease-3 related protein